MDLLFLIILIDLLTFIRRFSTKCKAFVDMDNWRVNWSA